MSHSHFSDSVSYLFNEQFLTTANLTLATRDIGLCCLAAYLVVSVLLGFQFYAAFLVILTTLFIIIDMFGLMYLLEIPLNAVSKTIFVIRGCVRPSTRLSLGT